MSVAPDLNRVHEGFAREDLFVCVHEQFMTETAQVADIILPATMFLEHDDVYQAGGHQHITLGPRIVNPPEGCRSNHEVICALAKRLSANHAGFDMTLARSSTGRCRTPAGATLKISSSNTGSTASPRSATLIIWMALPTTTDGFTSHRIGMPYCPTALDLPTPSCRACRTTGT